jgi:hypothetical protein
MFENGFMSEISNLDSDEPQLDVELRRSICPLWLKAGRYPEPVGSSTLLKIGDDCFALTAAHVMDCFQGRDIHVGNSHAFRPVVGEISVSVPPDTTDTAFIRLHRDIASWLSEDFRFLSMEEVSIDDLPAPMSGYQFFGVPYRKVPERPSGRHFHFPVYSYAAASLDNAKYTELGILPATHVAVDFVQRRVKDGTGRTITAPNPEGMSGGAVFTCPRVLLQASAAVTARKRLAAIAIEHRSQALIGVRIGVLLDAIRRFAPHLRSLIPACPPWLQIREVNKISSTAA